MLLKEVAASRQWDSASLSRLAFWVEVLGDRTISEVTADEVDDAAMRLAERARLRAGRRRTERSGQPLQGSTVNRYVEYTKALTHLAKLDCVELDAGTVWLREWIRVEY